MRIAQISDIHIDDELAVEYSVDARKNFLTIMEDIKSKNIDRIILTGDLGDPNTTGFIFDIVKQSKSQYDFVLGNHDNFTNYRDQIQSTSVSTSEELYYRKLFNSDLFLFLDSSSSIIKNPQINWLNTQLNRSGYNRVFIFIHHPIFDCGNTIMDKLYPLKERDKVQDILFETNRAIFIFCGHYHTFHEQIIKDVAQYVTPSALLQIQQKAKEIAIDRIGFGYRVITIDVDSVNTEVIMFDNSTD
jgi:Icc protein